MIDFKNINKLLNIDDLTIGEIKEAFKEVVDFVKENVKEYKSKFEQENKADEPTNTETTYKYRLLSISDKQKTQSVNVGILVNMSGENHLIKSDNILNFTFLQDDNYLENISYHLSNINLSREYDEVLLALSFGGVITSSVTTVETNRSVSEILEELKNKFL